MPRFLWCALAGLALSVTGCQRSVPEDIINKSLSSSLRSAPGIASAMCGMPVRGLSSVTVTIKQRGEKNTGVAHVVGQPWFTKGAPDRCEGDVEYAYSYSTKSSRSGRTRRTTVTWSLDALKLVAVQTPGVAMKAVSETPPADDGDEGATPGATK